jgi:hypothetical protein
VPSTILSSITAEFRRYKALGDSALAQLDDSELAVPDRTAEIQPRRSWHIGGNLASRFTDFLTSDGEKAWRQRDEEFVQRAVTRHEVLEKWNTGWNALFNALDGPTDDHLRHTVMIRGQSFEVHNALPRALAHVAYHVGQIVYLAKSVRGDSWTCLSIPIGASRRITRTRRTRIRAHAAAIRDQREERQRVRIPGDGKRRSSHPGADPRTGGIRAARARSRGDAGQPERLAVQRPQRRKWSSRTRSEPVGFAVWFQNYRRF